MKKFVLFLTALALAISLIFPAFPARAASNYDNAVNLITDYQIQNSRCDGGAPTTIKHSDVILQWYGNSEKYQYTSYYQRFKDMKFNPEDSWYMTNYTYADYNGTKHKVAYFVYMRKINPSTSRPKALFDNSDGYSSVYVQNPSTSDYKTIALSIRHDDNCKIKVADGGWGGWLKLSDSNTRSFTPTPSPYRTGSSLALIYNYDVRYPDNYQGENIDDYSGARKQVIRPDFLYSVDYKTLKAKDVNQNLPKPTKLADGYTFKGYQVEWSLFSCGDSGTTSISCPSPELKKYGSLDQVSEFFHTVSDYGRYKLSAKYLLQQCYRYPSYPATPDRCVNLTNRDFKNYDFIDTTVILNINGKNISGDTRAMDCSELGYCEEKPELKDCSVYGANIIAAIGCHLHNFFINLKNFFIFAFVPNSGHLRDSFSGFVDVLKNSLGFLWTPVDFIIKTVQLLTGNLPNPTGDNCSVGNVGFFGSQSRSLEFCAWRHKLPDLWAMLRLFAQGAIAWLVISMFWRKFAHFFGIDISGSGDDSDDSDGYRISDDYIIIDERRGISQKVGDYRKGGSY